VVSGSWSSIADVLVWMQHEISPETKRAATSRERDNRTSRTSYKVDLVLSLEKVDFL
jgi:hypothetical protein